MGLFERTHLPDQNGSVRYRGPSRRLRCTALMVFINISYSRPAERAACFVGVDGSWRRVPCRAFWTASLCPVNGPWRSFFKWHIATSIERIETSEAWSNLFFDSGLLIPCRIFYWPHSFVVWLDWKETPMTCPPLVLRVPLPRRRHGALRKEASFG